MHTWTDPEINQIQTQNQAKQMIGQMKTRKKCSIKVIPTTTRVWLSLSAHPRVYLHVLYSFLPNKYFTCFTTFCIFVETDFLKSHSGQGLLSGHWSLMLKWLRFSTLTDMAQLQSLASNQNPASNFCKPRPPRSASPGRQLVKLAPKRQGGSHHRKSWGMDIQGNSSCEMYKMQQGAWKIQGKE